MKRYTVGHPRAPGGGFVLEHQLVMEQRLRRKRIAPCGLLGNVERSVSQGTLTTAQQSGQGENDMEQERFATAPEGQGPHLQHFLVKWVIGRAYKAGAISALQAAEMLHEDGMDKEVALAWYNHHHQAEIEAAEKALQAMKDVFGFPYRESRRNFDTGVVFAQEDIDRAFDTDIEPFYSEEYLAGLGFDSEA